MSRVSFLALFCTPFVYACILLYSVCTPFVLRLYPVCAARDVSSLGLLYSVCTPLYSRVLRLYSFVPLGMSFPIGFCSPFVPVCTLTRLANIILLGDGRSTKVQKCASVLRALYWAPVGQTGSLRHAPLPRRWLLCHADRCAKEVVRPE